MKKNIFLLVISLITFTTFGQDAAEKKYQAGLVAGFGLNIQKMGTKLMEANGMGNDLTIGANLNMGFTETIGLCTGIEFDFETLKYKTPGTDSIWYYYRSDNNELVQYQDISATNSAYRLDSRRQKPIYISIPTMLIFRTKFIGYFRYFGKFGLRTSVLLSNKFTDEGANIDPITGDEIDKNANADMTAKGEMFPIKSAVGLAGGAEWNFVGSTSLVAEVGYYYGFTPLHNSRKSDKSYLWSTASAEIPPVFSNQATQSQIMFKLSVLF